MKIISLIDESLRNLEQGNIKISLMKMLNKNLDLFVELLGRFSEDLTVKTWKGKDVKSEIKQVLQYRTCEVNNFVRFYNLVDKFYSDFLSKSDLGKFNFNLLQSLNIMSSQIKFLNQF